MSDFINPTQINSESMSNSTASYKAAFGEDNSYIPQPAFRYIMLEIAKKTASGILLQENRNKDTDEIRKIVAVGKDCLEAKVGDYALIGMMNRPDFVYGPNGTEYFLTQEFNIKVFYRKETIEQPNLFTSTIAK